MNAQHKVNRLANRARRIPRVMRAIVEEKADEIVTAKRSNREPNLSHLDARLHQLRDRAEELAA